MRETIREGYGWAELRQDLAAGVVTGIIALPLSMALAIASGAPPQHGLYTAIVAGAIIALLGGARTSVSGPTAAFVVLLAPVTEKFGLGGLLTASMMAGLMLVLMGWAGMGKLIQFVPYPVTTGFTAGIGVVIASLQVKDFLGLTLETMPEHSVERVGALFHALPTWRPADGVIGLLTLAVLVLWPKVNRQIPPALIALTLAAGAAAWAAHLNPDWSVATIQTRFNGIPRHLPAFQLPWSERGLTLDLIRALFPSALAIALLGAIESLLCAVVADGMTGRKHDPDAELVAQGIGNLAAPFFGGMAATAAIARTAANVRAGAQSPFASVTHAVFLLLALLVLAPLLSYLPMAALAALLLQVAWRISDARHFLHIVKVAPRSDVSVLLVCFTLTVVFDMVISVSVGILLAALLFMRRMSEMFSIRVANGDHPHLQRPLPAEVRMYEIAGPLFFGAAEKAATMLAQDHGNARAVILLMSAVPSLDMTGLVALETAVTKLRKAQVTVILAGVQPYCLKVLAKAGMVTVPGELMVFATLAEAEDWVARRAWGAK